MLYIGFQTAETDKIRSMTKKKERSSEIFEKLAREIFFPSPQTDRQVSAHGQMGKASSPVWRLLNTEPITHSILLQQFPFKVKMFRLSYINGPPLLLWPSAVSYFMIGSIYLSI